MFTGIIEGIGSIKHMSLKGEDALLEISTSINISDVKVGDSISVNGACLTVKFKTNSGFTADVSAETLSRTNFQILKMGDIVNLEKALRLNDFLGGHIVLGHIDGVGIIKGKVKKSNSLIVGIGIDESLSRYIVEKGSIAVDGISLTVNRCEKDCFYVNLIPHTTMVTTIGSKKVGEPVNIETDILAKYLERLCKFEKDKGRRKEQKIDLKFLANHGYLR